MNRYFKNTALLIIFAGLVSATSAHGIDFEFMQQQATVEQGGDTEIEFGLFPSERSGAEPNLELLVDQNGDGEYSSDEVIAETEFDIENYTELDVNVQDVSLDAGTYDYTARLRNGSGYYYYPYEDGSLTVESDEEFEPEIESIELEKEAEGPYNAGEEFQVLVSTESEDVVYFETYMNYDNSKVDLVGVEPVSSSFFAERRPSSSPGTDIVTGQSENPLDSPEMAMVTFQAEQSGYTQITTNNSEIGTETDTFTNVGEDEVPVSINGSDSSDTKVEEITAEVSATTAVEVKYDSSQSKNFEIDATGEQAIIKEVADKIQLRQQRVDELIEIEREDTEVEIRADIGDSTVVSVRSSTDEELNQKFNLSFTNRKEIIAEVASRTKLEREGVEENIEFNEEESEVEIEADLGNPTDVEVSSSTDQGLNQEFKLNYTNREEVIRGVVERTDLEANKVRANIEFEEPPLEEMRKETLIERIQELRTNKTEELQEENAELRRELNQVEEENKKLERENERLRERLGETNSSYTPENRTESEGQQGESSSRPSEVPAESDRDQSTGQNQSGEDGLSQEEVGILQQIISIFN